MSKSSFPVIAAIAIAVALALGGCGGSSSGTSSESSGGGGSSTTDTTVTTSSHTKAEFIKLANSICKRDKANIEVELGLYAKEHEANTPAESITAAVRAVFLPKVQSQIEEIQALGAPRGDEQQIEGLLAALQEAVDTGSQEGSGSGEGSPSSGATGASTEPFSEANVLFTKIFRHSAKLARAYGLDECAYA